MVPLWGVGAAISTVAAVQITELFAVFYVWYFERGLQPYVLVGCY